MKPRTATAACRLPEIQGKRRTEGGFLTTDFTDKCRLRDCSYPCHPCNPWSLFLGNGGEKNGISPKTWCWPIFQIAKFEAAANQSVPAENKPKRNPEISPISGEFLRGWCMGGGSAFARSRGATRRRNLKSFATSRRCVLALKGFRAATTNAKPGKS
jgi:hypothetical protein